MVILNNKVSSDSLTALCTKLSRSVVSLEVSLEISGTFFFSNMIHDRRIGLHTQVYIYAHRERGHVSELVFPGG